MHDYTSVCTYMYKNKFHNCNCVTVSAVTIVNKLKVIAYNLIISIKLYFCAYLLVQPHVHNIFTYDLQMSLKCHYNCPGYYTVILRNVGKVHNFKTTNCQPFTVTYLTFQRSFFITSEKFCISCEKFIVHLIKR